MCPLALADFFGNFKSAVVCPFLVHFKKTKMKSFRVIKKKFIRFSDSYQVSRIRKKEKKLLNMFRVYQSTKLR